MKNTLLVSLLAALFLPLAAAFPQSLTPSAPPGPTMQTLDQLGAKADQANAKLDQANSKADQIITQTDKRIPISSIPFDITKPGSYYLTQNVGSAAPGIVAKVSGVTIDLNGFTITGPGNSVSGTGSGISGFDDTVVRNGRVKDFGDDGVKLGAACVVENLDVVNVGGNCITVGEQSRVQRCRVGAGQQGIVTGDSSLVEACQSIGNSGSDDGIATGRGGIRIGSYSTITNCVSSYNAGLGIGALNNCVISHCVASHNSTFSAIATGDSCKIANCDASYNSTSQAAGIVGIFTGASCEIEGSVSSFNLAGALLHSDSCVRSCTFASDGNGVVLGGNRCKVIDCTITGATDPSSYAILSNGNGNLIDGNTIRGNAGTGISAGLNSKAVIIRNVAGQNNGSGGSYGQIASGNNMGPVAAPENATSPFSNLLN